MTDNKDQSVVVKDKSPAVRNSNLELFRIIAMLLIVADHYVMTSGLLEEGGPVLSDPLSVRSVFLILFGMWGKTSINCFVMITGYFMCQSSISLRKYLKLLLEVEFYKIVIYLIFAVAGYEKFSLVGFVYAVWPFNSVSNGFVPCLLLFYPCIPFINILVRHMEKKQHLLLIAVMCFIYSILSLIPKIEIGMNYVSWFFVLYLIAAYIRLYPDPRTESVKFTGWLALSSVVISISSVAAVLWGSVHFLHKAEYYYYFVNDSNKILALLSGVSLFLFFKNLKVRTNRFINTVAASTFGVLLIHSNSDTMRRWLWKDLLDNVGAYQSKYWYVHAIASVIGVFVCCTLIDCLRRVLLEKPFFRLYDRIAKRAERSSAD